MKTRAGLIWYRRGKRIVDAQCTSSAGRGASRRIPCASRGSWEGGMRANVSVGKAILRTAVLLALGACGAESPPYDDLPLRDALSAAPEVLAALPEEALHDLAVRLEEAHGAQGGETA